MGGGFVQVGYNEERFQQDVDKYVVGKTHNRHIGKGGFILIANHNWSLVSDPFKNEGLNLYVSGLWVDPDETPMDEVFHATVYNTPCSCMFATMEGYYIVATVPDDEIVMQRDTSVALTSARRT